MIEKSIPLPIGKKTYHDTRYYYKMIVDELHAELCFAEALLLKALLTFIEDETLVSFIRAGIKIRSCFNSYKYVSLMIFFFLPKFINMHIYRYNSFLLFILFQRMQCHTELAYVVRKRKILQRSFRERSTSGHRSFQPGTYATHLRMKLSPVANKLYL